MTATPSLRSSVLLIFLDGVGIGSRDPVRNPLFASPLPFLSEILDGRLPSLRGREINATSASSLALDARLGVRGLPQSGTGQSTLYTGLNTAKHINRHFGPYLYSTLKPLVAELNVFQQLIDLGVPHDNIALANAFPQRFFEYLLGERRRMVAGMFSALSSDVPFRSIDHLKQGDAVSSDITAERWGEIGHPDAPVISPRLAGVRLGHMTRQYRFTMFEYFLTDKAGHERSHPFAAEILAQLDQFLRGVYDQVDHEHTVTIITSDHGNLEELSTKSHTRNPVPLIAFGRNRLRLITNLKSISEVTPAIVRFLLK